MRLMITMPLVRNNDSDESDDTRFVNFKFLFWNINGITSNIIDPDFGGFLHDFDFLCFV